MFTWDFILGEVKVFHFGIWSIFCNCLHEIRRNETHCGCYFIAVTLISFWLVNFYITFVQANIKEPYYSSCFWGIQTASKKCLLPRKQKIIYLCFQLKLATKCFTFLDRDSQMKILCNYSDNNLKSSTLVVKSIRQMFKNFEFLSAHLFTE